MSRQFVAAAVGAIAWVAFSSAVGRAEADPDSRAKREAGSSNPQTTIKYDSTSGQPERFTGEIVCLRADKRLQPAAGAAECPDDTRVLALRIDDSDALQPLIAVDETIHDKLVDKIGEHVVVEGKRYEASGMIMASTVLSERAAK
jgi:hypothetical protein